MILTTAMTVAILVVLGLMLWDQLRLKQMRPHKWVIWFALLAVLLGNTWMT